MRPFLKQIWRCMYMYAFAHPHIFSSDYYHFYGREILQYIARTCLRNGFLICLTSQSTIFSHVVRETASRVLPVLLERKYVLLKYTTWRPERGSCVVPLPSLQEAEVKNKIRGSLEKKTASCPQVNQKKQELFLVRFRLNFDVIRRILDDMS